MYRLICIWLWYFLLMPFLRFVPSRCFSPTKHDIPRILQEKPKHPWLLPTQMSPFAWPSCITEALRTGGTPGKLCQACWLCVQKIHQTWNRTLPGDPYRKLLELRFSGWTGSQEADMFNANGVFGYVDHVDRPTRMFPCFFISKGYPQKCPKRHFWGWFSF